MRAKHWSKRRRNRFEEKRKREAERAVDAAQSKEMFDELAECRTSEFERLALETNQTLVPFDDSPMGSFDPGIRPAPSAKLVRLRIVASNDAPIQPKKGQLELPLAERPSMGHWL